MPLDGKSLEAYENNSETEKTPDQALAIAYAMKRRAKKMPFAGVIEPETNKGEMFKDNPLFDSKSAVDAILAKKYGPPKDDIDLYQDDEAMFSEEAAPEPDEKEIRRKAIGQILSKMSK